MRSSPLLSPALVALLALACEPVAEGGTQGAQGAQGGSLALNQSTQGSGAQIEATPQSAELRAFVYPEEMELMVDWTIQTTNIQGTLERYRETFQSDGLGNMRLDVTGFSPDLVQPFQAPTSDQALDYENRMRFMVQYRNLHVRAFHAARLNYRWVEDANLVQVAGIDCIRTRAISKHGHGDFEILSDAQTDLVLGWTKFAPNGSVSMKLEATAVNLAPNLNGVVWSAPVVGETEYSMHQQHMLTFEPATPQYLPAGFYEEEAWLRFSAGLFPGMSDMLVTLYSDGLQLLFVAQHGQSTMGTQLKLLNRATEVRQYDLGGVRVAEGLVGKRKFYVASMMSLDEITTVFGSLLD